MNLTNVDPDTIRRTTREGAQRLGLLDSAGAVTGAAELVDYEPDVAGFERFTFRVS